MKRLLYLATLLMAASLIFTPAAIAQNLIQEQGCPPGQTSNAAGTTCVDLATGEVVTDLGTNPNSNPCPEGVAQLPDGTCNIPAEIAEELPAEIAEELVEDPEEPQAENVAEAQLEAAIEEQVEAQQGTDLTPAQDAALEPQAEIENQQPKQKEKMKEIPKTGGIPINSSLVGLGAGVLLVGGGLIALKRRNS